MSNPDGLTTSGFFLLKFQNQLFIPFVFTNDWPRLGVERLMSVSRFKKLTD